MEFEDVRKKFGELPSRSVGWSALFALSILLFLIQATEKLLKGTSFVSQMLLAGISTINGQPVVALWLVIVVSVLIALLLLLLILLAQSAEAQRLERKKLTAIQLSAQKAERAFTETMHAAAVIRSQQTPDQSHTVKTIEEVAVVYRIEKDFTTRISKQYKIRAAAGALHFWETSIQPSSDATPMEYLSDIRFKVLDVTNPAAVVALTYLQTQNDVRLKRVCTHFLPRLLASDPPRTIEVSYTWPNYLAQLRKTGREGLFQNFNSAGGTRLVTIDVWFEDGGGGTGDFQIISTYPSESLPIKEPGWSGRRYQAKDLPPGRQEHKLSATWTDAG